MATLDSDVLGLLFDAMTRFDDPAAARSGIAEAVCRLAGAEGGVLLLGHRFAAPAPGDAPDADYGPTRPKAVRVLELLPVFGHTNPVLPILARIKAPVFAVPEVVGRAAWENSPYYREFLGPATDTHAVLGVRFGAAGGMWLGHPDRRRFTSAERHAVQVVAEGIGRGLTNLERHRACVAAARAAGPLDPDAARAAGLSPREVDVLLLLADGLSHKQVAAELGMSYHTVITHVRALFAKLDARRRVDAINAVRRLGAPRS